MMLSGHNRFTYVFITASVVILLLAFTHPAGASSFANLNMFGFPAGVGQGNSLSGLSEVTSSNGAISASSASYSPSSQFTGFFGSGLEGVQMGVNFACPVASHDASTVAFARSVAYEAILGDDAISFPEINVDLGSSFPTIESVNSDVKYMENVQFQLSTESDTMPMTGFSFPGFFGSFL
jgi:hypothetical protein